MIALNHVHNSFQSKLLDTISVSTEGEQEQQKQTVNERLSKVCFTLQTNICGEWKSFSVYSLFFPHLIWKVKFWYLVAGKIMKAKPFTDMTEI